MRSAIEKLLQALKARGCNPTATSTGYSALCPSHDDLDPSLNVSEGENGNALLHCHAGCDPDVVCNDLGLEIVELMGPSNNSTNRRPRREQERHERPDKRKQYDSVEAAMADLEGRKGRVSTTYRYQDEEGQLVGLILRWDAPEQGKEIRPLAKCGDHWVVGGMPEPRPLYGYPEITEAKLVFIVEGEKPAEYLRNVGLAATTSAHGANSASKTDWSPLAGKTCVLMADNDPQGEQYRLAVTRILSTLSPVPVLKYVDLPDLPVGGDAADFIEANSDKDSEELKRGLMELATKANVVPLQRTDRRVAGYEPFPVDSLPKELRDFVLAGSKAIGCDAAYLVLPLLSALAASIGSARTLQLKQGWNAPAIIWSMIVGESGSSKTPAFKLALQPWANRQRRAFNAYDDEEREYQNALALYEKEIARWRRQKHTDEPPPEPPERPTAHRCLVQDTTIEALCGLLLDNPRGLLLAMDELAGWFGSFERYRGGKGGSDGPHWLSMFNGNDLAVDRKTGEKNTIFIPNACVSITGGIQPTILNRVLGIEHRESGLAARFLLACPPRMPKTWTDNDVDPSLVKRMEEIVDRLYKLDPIERDDGQKMAKIVRLSPEAKEEWIRFYNQHAVGQAELSGDLAAAWSKMEEYAARIALVIHLVRSASDDPDLASPDELDAASMKAGIAITEWFKRETHRVYSILSEDDEQRDQRQLAEWIERKGGAVTVRQVQQGQRKYRKAESAEAALNDLVSAGDGTWRNVPPGPNGGRPSRKFQLSMSTKPSKSTEQRGFVDVDRVDNQESHQDWGEV